MQLSLAVCTPLTCVIKSWPSPCKSSGAYCVAGVLNGEDICFEVPVVREC